MRQLILTTAIILLVFFAPSQVSANSPTTCPPEGCPLGFFKGIGAIANFNFSDTGASSAGARFARTMSITIGVTTISAGIWFIIQVFTAAFAWLISNGDKQAIEASRKKITNAVIGLFLVVFSYGFTAIIGSVLGINILNPVAVLLGLDPNK